MEIWKGFASVAFMGNLNRKTAIALISGELLTMLISILYRAAGWNRL